MISSFQEVDVHGMNKVQAFTAIDAVLRRANGSVYTIHGYMSERRAAILKAL